MININDMEISITKNPIKVLVYSDILDPQAANKIRKFSSTSIEVHEVFSLTDTFLVNDIDVIIVESGAYQNLIRNMRLCNRSLQNIPVLAIIYYDEPPTDNSINYVMIHDATSHVLVQMVYMLYHIAANKVHYPVKDDTRSGKEETVDKVQVAKDLANIQKKYMPELIRIRDELATGRIQDKN